MKTADYPLGEPVASTTITNALEDAAALTRRVQTLHDKLLGERPEAITGESRAFFEGRDGRLNGMADTADRVRTMVAKAFKALEDVEEAMGVDDRPMGSIPQSAFVGGPNAERTISRAA